MNQRLVELQRQVSAKRIIVDGSILSGLMGTVVIASMFYHAEIFHDDYPPDIQEKAGPMSQRAKRQRRIVALTLFLLLFGVPSYSNLKLKRRHQGKLTFLAAWLNAYAVSAVFKLFDLLVIDYLIVIGLQPEFVVLPGTAHEMRNEIVEELPIDQRAKTEQIEALASRALAKTKE